MFLKMKLFINLNNIKSTMSVKPERTPLFQESGGGNEDLTDSDFQSRNDKAISSQIWKLRKQWLVFGAFLFLYQVFFVYHGWFISISTALETSGVIIVLCSTFLMISKFIFSQEIFPTPLSYLDTSPGETTLSINQNLGRPNTYTGVKQGYLIAVLLFGSGFVLNIFFVIFGLL